MATQPLARRKHYEQGDQPSAADMNFLCGAIAGAQGEYPIEVIVDIRGLLVRLAGPLASTWDIMGYRTKVGNTITIRKRAIRIHQVATVAIPDTDVHLTGSVCWIYVSIPRSNYGSYEVLVASVEPVSDESALNIPLYSFTLNTTTGGYNLDTAGKFDVNIDNAGE